MEIGRSESPLIHRRSNRATAITGYRSMHAIYSARSETRPLAMAWRSGPLFLAGKSRLLLHCKKDQTSARVKHLCFSSIACGAMAEPQRQHFLDGADVMLNPNGASLPISTLLPTVTTIHDLTPMVMPYFSRRRYIPAQVSVISLGKSVCCDHHGFRAFQTGYRTHLRRSAIEGACCL